LQKKKSDKTPYQLSVAVSAGPEGYKNLVVPEMDKAIDYWNLMAYDYAGSWGNFTDHQANLYGPSLSGYSTEQAIQWFTKAGAAASKITMGIPLYGRAFEETTGIGAKFNGIGPGTTSPGIYAYSALRELAFPR
jgi:chitinase